MLFSKLLPNRLAFEYTKGEVALMVISSVILIVLNYFMITGLKAQHSVENNVESVRMNR